MKPLNILGAAVAILASNAVASSDSIPNPAADTGLVSVFASQSAQLNIVNLGDPAETCSFELSFIDATGATVPTPLDVANLGGGAAASLTVGPISTTTQMRAHIDFTPQLIANAGQRDPMQGCYKLIPTFEVTDATSTRVLDTRFYGMPSPEKGKKVTKVKVCHKPGTPAEKSLEIPTSAMKGHLDHGDTPGECADHQNDD